MNGGTHWLALPVVLLVVAGCMPPVSDAADDARIGRDSDHTPHSCAPTISPDEQPGGLPELRVATFNVYRLFDTRCDSGDCGRNSYERTPSSGRLDNRLDAIADALRPIEADILVFQEIETKSLLERIASKLSENGRDYRARVFGEIGREASLDVGLLADANHLGTVRYRDDRTLNRPDGSQTYFTREFLETNLEYRGEKLTIFGAHFKSRHNDDPGRRLAEAQEAGEILGRTLDDHPNRLTLLAGDLNTTPGSPPLDALLDNSSIRRAGADSDTWSYCFDGQRKAIDHILFAGGCGGAYITGSLRRWGASQCPGNSGLDGSDHAAVSADFVLR